MRGDLVSRPIGEVMIEAENLLKAGVRELLVVSQDTSAYGVDVRYRTGFWRGRPLKTRMTELAPALASAGRPNTMPGFACTTSIRIRMSTRSFALMASDGGPGLLPYLDVPFQHASPRILKLMKRPANVENNLQRIRAWRDVCPELTIRSTFIVGFPGETDAEFEALLEFLSEAELDRVGCFAYSPVDGAAANALPDPVPRRRCTKSGAPGSWQRRKPSAPAGLKRRIGATLRVLVDSHDGARAIGAQRRRRAGDRWHCSRDRRSGARRRRVRPRAHHRRERARSLRRSGLTRRAYFCGRLRSTAASCSRTLLKAVLNARTSASAEREAHVYARAELAVPHEGPRRGGAVR